MAKNAKKKAASSKKKKSVRTSAGSRGASRMIIEVHHRFVDSSGDDIFRGGWRFPSGRG